MASSSSGRAKSSGVSSSSFFDLKAELSKREAEFSKSKAGGKASIIVGGVKRPDKKPTLWGRQNKGIKARMARDIELEAVSKPTLENARATLERKAALYDKLKRGKTGGLTDKQYESLLVDFDQPGSGSSGDDSSEDEDESLTVPHPPNQEDDPMVEYEDEFGRMRTARKSEVPRNLPSKTEEISQEYDPYIIRGDQGFFPVYEPSAERVKDIEEAFVADSNPAKYYDASQEVRAAAAGFYQFSADEETRRKQMEDLKKVREETEAERARAVAEGPTPGSRESTGSAKTTIIIGRGIDKRKRDIEERRKAIEAKRRKTSGFSIQASLESSADDFLAKLEEDIMKPKS